MPKKILYLKIAVIIILGFISYANSIDGKFIWDDNGLIKNNLYIRSWSNTPKIVTQDIGAGSLSSSNFYRPVQIISYLTDYSYWGLRVRGYHLTNILLHILAAVAFYWFIGTIFHYGALAFIASLLFVTHPIHTEAVSYISGRADSLALLFILLTMVWYVKSLVSNKIKYYILAILSYALAIFSKENSIILPALILLYHYIFAKKLKLGYFLWILGVTLGYIFLRLATLSYTIPDIATPVSLIQRIPGFFVAVTEYIKLLLFPFNLHMEYGNRLFTFSDPQAIFGMLSCALLLVFSFHKHRSNKILSFSILWFFITILPFSNIYIINESYMMEHWLYMPSLGFFLILASGACYPLKNKTAALLLRVLTAGLIIFYAYLTIKQNEYWREPVDFYKRTLQYAPRSWRFYNELGNEYINVDSDIEAITAYNKALEINPNLAGVYNNLGNVYRKKGRPTEALLMYNKAQEINLSLARQYYEKAKAYLDSGKKREAAIFYEKALALDPYNLKSYNTLASVYIMSGKYSRAITLLKQALEIAPGFALTHNNLSAAYYYERKYDLAIKHCDIAVGLGYDVTPKLLELLTPYRK